jgi:hypothetical protein
MKYGTAEVSRGGRPGAGPGHVGPLWGRVGAASGFDGPVPGLEIRHPSLEESYLGLIGRAA